jgi:hypothetical protein
VKRLWNFLIDVADGILGAMLYGHQGGFGWTSTRTETQNAHKLRSWAASGKRAASFEDEPARPSRHDDFELRMRQFRRATAERGDPPDRVL